jgi:hypothetical protein
MLGIRVLKKGRPETTIFRASFLSLLGAGEFSLKLNG